MAEHGPFPSVSVAWPTFCRPGKPKACTIPLLSSSSQTYATGSEGEKAAHEGDLPASPCTSASSVRVEGGVKVYDALRRCFDQIEPISSRLCVALTLCRCSLRAAAGMDR